MNTPVIRNRFSSRKALAAAGALTLALAGCAAAPVSPQGSADVRTKLTRLQADPELAGRAPAAIKEAEVAVRTAEEPLTSKDDALGAHRVYMADRKVDIAAARASTRYAEDQRARLGEERSRARLDARTQEADLARDDAIVARGEAAAAQALTSYAEQQAEEMQRQIDALQAEATDRGLVLTLADVLFATGKSDVKIGAASNLNKLVGFLNQYPDRKALIEGHTDNVGSASSNEGLSQRRADSVKSYLMQQGIGSERLVASGKGESQPIANNDSTSGRQQNRRVVVVIENPPPSTASAE
ncbi:MAG: OmpA family protein [Gammaproteobacteria bacterium]|nr:OmpA family protein [Gammaproteobacteria bacterium]